MRLQPLDADSLLTQVSFDKYILDPGELKEIVDKSRDVFVAQIDRTFDRPEQIEKALEFVKTIWRKYDCEEIADIYDKFVKIEEALFGLEREEEIGKRYREHFVHMFNCFIFGLRIISSILEQATADVSQSIFKVEKENLREVGLPFGRNYGYDQRLFYLWTLMSTFHDIAIPFQHLTRLGRGISRFVEEFGWVFTDPRIAMHNFDSSQLYHYFDLISSIYGGRLKLIDSGRKYARPEATQHYLIKLFGREFDRRNHGVMSGFFMWKTIEEIFLAGRSQKYQFAMDQFNTYTECVLEQDVARAALAITLHGIGADQRSNVYPKVFPIAFESYPLTFILILSDELQEYLRWEGVSLKKQLKFNYHPIVDIKFDSAGATIETNVSFSLDGENKSAVIERANEVAKYASPGSPVCDMDGAVDLLGNSIKKTLERKLRLGQNFKLKLNIYQDWDVVRYSKELSSSA